MFFLYRFEFKKLATSLLHSSRASNKEQIVIYSCDAVGRDVFRVRGFFFHHYATHQARLCTNRNHLAVPLCDTEHGKGGHRAGGHNS